MPGLFIFEFSPLTETESMKLILLTLFFFCLSALSHGADCDPNDEIKQLSCFIADITKEIVEEKEVVPSRIYHYGEKNILDVDIKNKTVPQADWDQYIMGDTTRFALRKSRRGLYGTGGVDSNNFGYDKYNWLMEIKIKDSCRAPDKVAALSELSSNKKFIKWFGTTREDYTMRDFASQCVMTNYEGYPFEACDNIVDQFLRDEKIAIVQDEIIGKSFYIRDRSCVENIEGSPDFWVETLANRPNLWLDRCDNENLESLSSLLFHALPHMKKKFTKDLRDKLVKNLDLPLGLQPNQKQMLTQVLDAKLRCDLKNKTDFNNHHADGIQYPLIFPWGEFEKDCPK